MLVMGPQDWSGKISRLFAAFEQRCQSFYHDEHLAAGCFIAEGRQGSMERYPLLSLSIGAVHVKPDTAAELDAAHLAKLASQAKRLAKHTSGFSLHVVDTAQQASQDQSPSPAALAL